MRFILFIPDADIPVDGKRPRLSSYEPEEVKPLDSQHDDSARVKSGSILDQSEGSALPSAISLDKIQVGLLSFIFARGQWVCYAVYMFCLRVFELFYDLLLVL